MANRFWVGGTATWDASTTANWSTTSGGASGASVPGSADIAVFDGGSGAAVVTASSTLNATTIGGITFTGTGGFAGTLDFATNNPSMTITGQFSITGSGARTLNLGSGTFTFTGTGTFWDATTVTNLTFNAGTSTLAVSNTSPSALRTFIGGGLSYSTVTLGQNGGSTYEFRLNSTGTITNFTVTGPNSVWVQGAYTLTNLTITGTSTTPVLFWVFETNAATNTITTTTANINYAVLGGNNWSGSPVANNSFNLGKSTGITINPPTGGGGVIG